MLTGTGTGENNNKNNNKPLVFVSYFYDSERVASICEKREKKKIL